MLTTLWLTLFGCLWVIQDVLLPFIIAAFWVTLLNPIVTQANQRGLLGRKPPRWAAVLMVYVAFFGIVYISSIFVGPQIAKEMVKLTETTSQLADRLTDEKIDNFARETENKLAEYSIYVRILGPKGPQPEISANSPESLFTLDIGQVWRQMLKDAALYLKQETRQILSQVQLLITGLMGFFFKFFLVLMLTAFLLADIERVKRFFFSMIPLEDQNEFDGLMERFDRGLSGVVRGQLLICVVNGILTLVGLLIFNVKFCVRFSDVSCNFLAHSHIWDHHKHPSHYAGRLNPKPFTGIAALVWILLIHFIEGNFLNPKIMGDAAKIHPALVVLALMTGQHFYGISGALFAVPIASIVVTVFTHILNKAQVLDRNITIPPPARDEA